MECDVLGVGGEEVSLTASSRQPTARIDPVPRDTYKGRSLRESCRDFSGRSECKPRTGSSPASVWFSKGTYFSSPQIERAMPDQGSDFATSS